MISDILKKQKSLIPYFTAGDPSLAFTEKLITTCFDAGIKILELGIPFSDPIADGPTIQKSHFRSLTNNPNIGIREILKLVKKVKANYKKEAIVFMASANLILAYGIAKFFTDAKTHHLAGIIIPDLPPEEADEYLIHAKKHNIDIIFLLSTLTLDQRLKLITNSSNGFVYLMSSTGITGERATIPTDLKNTIKKVKNIRDIPVSIGFGISKKEHVKSIFSYADGAIIGSHLVKIIENNLSNPDLALQKIKERIQYFLS